MTIPQGPTRNSRNRKRRIVCVSTRAYPPQRRKSFGMKQGVVSAECSMRLSRERYAGYPGPGEVPTCKMAESISSSLAQLRLSGHEGVKQQRKVRCSRHCLWSKQNKALRIQYGFQLRRKSILWSASSTRPARLHNPGSNVCFSEQSFHLPNPKN